MTGFTNISNERMRVNKSFRKYPSPPLKSRFQNSNFEHLKNLVDYFSHLRSIGQLTDKEFTAYMTWFCASFVEKEIAGFILELVVKPFRRIFEEI